jgi:hypothetical protein
VSAQAQDRYLDDPAYPDTFRQDLSAWLALSWWPASELRLYARARFVDESVDDPRAGEESLWSYVEASWRPAPAFLTRFRYDNRIFLDERDSTLGRRPNPEHWFRVEVESRF